MHRCPYRLAAWGAVVVTAAAGCSAQHSIKAPAPPGSAASLPVGTIAVSPAGVTTAVNVPAASSEEEYFQACHAAKTWMQDRPGDRQSMIEPYLATVQAPGAGGAGTWNTAWAQLRPAQQAAVIVAVRAAADDECG
ncbi:hypothetical protein A5707_18910 [Mycobacterium kyorinense]|uniref:Lipoprotein LpqV n=1 Tax=Mycobacterium kyorinense TaxID=487514 RepID=A0A1A2ZEN4_9MYCO|nr:lipoprotein LpqV [Mycobacterium kyorinense]OBI47546.1 hypothetical protein A5707_18910 [Mycobacterium kyorinense]